MISSRRTIPILLLLSVVLFSCFVESAEKMKIKADKVFYDPDSDMVTAEGNVVVTRKDMVLKGGSGRMSKDGDWIEFSGDVKFWWDKEKLRVSAENITYEASGDIISASGGVEMTAPKRALTAFEMSVIMARENFYFASGDVELVDNGRKMSCSVVNRNGDEITAQNVKELYDPNSNMVINGRIFKGWFKGDQISSLEVTGGVTIAKTDERGRVTKVTGDKAYYSQLKGSIVVAGNAKAYQGKNVVNAGSLVYHINSGRVEAVGGSEAVIFVK